MYHKLETQQATTTTELDENNEVVKAAARLAGVSVQAVLAHYLRMSYLENNTQTHASGFRGISLGRVELPVMNRGVVHKDGWRAATIGPDAIVPKLPRGQVAVSVSEEMAREAGNIVDDEAALKYTYGIAWSDEDQEYVGTCVQFPGLSWLAKDRDEALDGIKQLVKEEQRHIDVATLQEFMGAMPEGEAK